MKEPAAEGGQRSQEWWVLSVQRPLASSPHAYCAHYANPVCMLAVWRQRVM